MRSWQKTLARVFLRYPKINWGMKIATGVLFFSMLGVPCLTILIEKIFGEVSLGILSLALVITETPLLIFLWYLPEIFSKKSGWVARLPEVQAERARVFLLEHPECGWIIRKIQEAQKGDDAEELKRILDILGAVV